MIAKDKEQVTVPEDTIRALEEAARILEALNIFIKRQTRGYHKIEIEEDEDEHNPDQRDAHSDQKNRC